MDVSFITIHITKTALPFLMLIFNILTQQTEFHKVNTHMSFESWLCAQLDFCLVLIVWYVNRDSVDIQVELV